MLAGLQQYRVGEYGSGVGADVKPGVPRVTLSLPPDDNEELQRHFHNRLMMLCGCSLQAFTQGIAAKASRKRKQPSVQASGVQPARPSAPMGMQAAAPSGPRASVLPGSAQPCGTPAASAGGRAPARAPGEW